MLFLLSPTSVKIYFYCWSQVFLFSLCSSFYQLLRSVLDFPNIQRFLIYLLVAVIYYLIFLCDINSLKLRLFHELICGNKNKISSVLERNEYSVCVRF